MFFHWLLQLKLIDLTVKSIFFADESVKGQIGNFSRFHLTSSKMYKIEKNAKLVDFIGR